MAGTVLRGAAVTSTLSIIRDVEIDGDLTITGVFTAAGINSKVGIDSGATPGYLGAAAGDGVLRVGASLTYTDGGDFVTLSVDATNVNHNSLNNTHNLTTDIDHDTITNTHNLTTDVDHDTITNTHNLTTDIDHGSISGLGDDDHTIYALVDGTRDFTGDLHVDGDFTNYNSALPDMGHFQTSDKRGYGIDYVTDKKLSNCLLGGNARTENGALKVDATEDPDTLEIYLRDQWNTIIYDFTVENDELEHTPLDETIDVWSGNSNLLGLNGLPIVQEYIVSMGAFPAKRFVDGGTF